MGGATLSFKANPFFTMSSMDQRFHAILVPPEGGRQLVLVDCVFNGQGFELITTPYIPGEAESTVAFQAPAGDSLRYMALQTKGHFKREAEADPMAGCMHWKVQVKALYQPCGNERNLPLGNSEVRDINGSILFVMCYDNETINNLIYFDLAGVDEFEEEVHHALAYLTMHTHLTRRMWGDVSAFAGGVIDPRQFDDYAERFQVSLALAIKANPYVPRAIVTSISCGLLNDWIHRHTAEEFVNFREQAPGSMEEATQYVKFALCLNRSNFATNEQNIRFWTLFDRCMELVVRHTLEYD